MAEEAKQSDAPQRYVQSYEGMEEFKYGEWMRYKDYTATLEAKRRAEQDERARCIRLLRDGPHGATEWPYFLIAADWLQERGE